MQPEGSIVRIFTDDGTVVGTGFFIGEGTFLACAHVIASSLGIDENTTAIPKTLVCLDFPLVDSAYRLTAQVTFWQPVQINGGGDIAVLQLNSIPPKGVKAARLVFTEDLWDHSFRAFGFPDRHNQGVWASGKLRAREATGWVQIEDVKESGFRVQRGFSGGGVWDEQLGGVVGMVVAAEEDASIRAAYIIPTNVLAKVWPRLESILHPPIASVLAVHLEAFLSALAGKLTSEIIKTRLWNDPAKDAIKGALAVAIQRYATSGSRLELARPLLQKDGPLTQPAIAEELAKIVRFEKPNTELIGWQWKSYLDAPPVWCDFTKEANLLLEYLQAELRNTEVFRPVFYSRSLDAIAVSAATSSEALVNIEAQLSDLLELMEGRFSDLTRAFTGASFSIREQISDYTRYIREKAYGFVGRQFVFDVLTDFTRNKSSGYFFVRGDPGIGKSALAAHMVKTSGYVHHFNIRSEGINRADTFLKNICAQLIVAYGLEHAFLPSEATQDAGFLNQLLREISGKLKPDEKAIIVIDALDEVDTLGQTQGSNVLYLPLTLPQGIYFVATTRRGYMPLRIDCEQHTLDIEHDSLGNIADIHEYVDRAVERPGIRAYISSMGIDEEFFIKRLVEKSEGNFMYLRYVVPEIEQGAYKDLRLEALPAGLKNYYEDHWHRMRSKDEESWIKYGLPIIMALTVVQEPVSIDFIAEHSGVQEHTRIRVTLREWEQFLHGEQIEYNGALQKRYGIYHMSFHDFMATKEEVGELIEDRKTVHRKLANSLWKKLYGTT